MNFEKPPEGTMSNFTELPTSLYNANTTEVHKMSLKKKLVLGLVFLLTITAVIVTAFFYFRPYLMYRFVQADTKSLNDNQVPVLKQITHDAKFASSPEYSAYGVLFHTPWMLTKKVDKNTVTNFTFTEKRAVSIHYPKSMPSILDNFGDQHVTTAADISKVYGAEASQSDYVLLTRILYTKPSDINLFKNRTRMAVQSISLIIKAVLCESNCQMFAINMNDRGLRGYVFYFPSSKMTTMLLYDNENNRYTISLYGFTPEEADQIIGSLSLGEAKNSPAPGANPITENSAYYNDISYTGSPMVTIAPEPSPTTAISRVPTLIASTPTAGPTASKYPKVAIEAGIDAQVQTYSETGGTVSTTIVFKNNTSATVNVSVNRISLRSRTEGAGNNENYFQVPLNAGQEKTFSLTYTLTEPPPYALVYLSAAGTQIKLADF